MHGMVRFSAWIALGLSLFLVTFGSTFFFMILLFIICTLIGATIAMIKYGRSRTEEIRCDFDTTDSLFTLPKHSSEPPPLPHSQHSDPQLTDSALVDVHISQILDFTLRDFVQSWYTDLTTDEEFRETLRLSASQIVLNFSHHARQVDWAPFLTQHFVDDFASHLRLYRKAMEKLSHAKSTQKCSTKPSVEDLETYFFDLEFEMESKYCRDLVSSSPQYEKAYLRDISDILLFLLLPKAEFDTKPFRLLLREVLVHRIFIPLVEQICDPDYLNQLIVWLLTEVPLNSNDCITVLEYSESKEELEAMNERVQEEMNVQRSRDTGDDDNESKEQLSSLAYMKRIISTKLQRLNSGVIDSDSNSTAKTERRLRNMKLSFLLSNPVAIEKLMDFMSKSSSNLSYLTLALDIQSFKFKAGQHIKNARHSAQRSIAQQDLETVREGALTLYDRYLSDTVENRVSIEDSLKQTLLNNIVTQEPSDSCFDTVEAKVYEALKPDFELFKQSEEYLKLLKEMDLLQEEEEFFDDGPPKLAAAIMRIGMCTESATKSYAIYYVMVSKESLRDDVLDIWHVARRYSDFRELHNVVIARWPVLASLHFPAKKTFNNLDQTFLEKRRHALNQYLSSLLRPDVLKANKGLETVMNGFLSRGPFDGAKLLSKKMFPVDSIISGMKTVGNVVLAVPDNLADGVSKVGDGLGKVTRSVLGEEIRPEQLLNLDFMSRFLPERWMENPVLVPAFRRIIPVPLAQRLRTYRRAAVSPTVARMLAVPLCTLEQCLEGVKCPSLVNTNSAPEGRVGASLEKESSAENIPLRIMLLLMDEVFNLKQRNQWFRRRLVAFLQQVIRATLGSKFNRRILEFVEWLASEEQVAEYIRAFKDSFWPNGILAESSPERSRSLQMQTRVVAKAKMLAAVPDELRLFIGSETTRTGVLTVFEAFQNKHLNKRLFYVLFERVLKTLFVQNRFEELFVRLHSKSPRCQQYAAAAK